MGFRASANDALLARGSAINLPGELEQVDEDDVARTWGDLLAGGVPLIFRGRTNATQAALARRSVSVISNPKVILNPKFAGKTSASASSSSTPTSSRASSTTSAPAATPTVGYTSSGLDLDGTHSGDATYFAPGLGACGTTASDTDYIVAVSHLIYDTFPGATANPNNNPVCGRKIAATWSGNTVTVTVQDECEGCAAWDLDFSPTAFLALAPLADGRLHGMTWNWV